MRLLHLLIPLLFFAFPVLAEEYPHLLLGNPSRAVADKAKKDNYLMEKPYFAVGYDDALRGPKWVSWRTTLEDTKDTGDGGRKRTFSADTTLPTSYFHVTHKDYAGSGFDRGHLCPHSDRVASKDMSYATFVMSNVVPQTAALNQKAWNSLEIYARDLLKGKPNRRLYQVAGVIGKGGGPTDSPVEGIGAAGKIIVPKECWKIIVVVDGGDDPDKDLGSIGEKTRVISAVMPNDDTPGLAWAKYRVSVGEIETKTGLSFFDKLPEKTRKALKENADDARIPTPRRTGNAD